MSKAVVCTTADGGVMVMHLADDADPASVEIPDGASHCVVDADDLPRERAFRAAWVRTEDGKVEVDLAKARDVWRDIIRQRREPLLAALDVDYQRADEAGDAKKKAAVAKRKERLRNATADPKIEKAETLDDLMSLDPLA